MNSQPLPSRVGLVWRPLFHFAEVESPRAAPWDAEQQTHPNNAMPRRAEARPPGSPITARRWSKGEDLRLHTPQEYDDDLNNLWVVHGCHDLAPFRDVHRAARRRSTCVGAATRRGSSSSSTS